MIKTFITGLLIYPLMVVSIYSLSVPDNNSGSVNFSNYRGKKILIVNTATGDSAAAHQLTELQQLYTQHQDSLVVIAFPSNSFGRQPGTNAEIKTIMEENYGITFPVAVKSPVKGDSANIIYRWLASKLQNEMMSARTTRDFQKYLIDREGRLIAKFDSIIRPLSPTIQNAISRY